MEAFLDDWLKTVISHRVDSPDTLANYTQVVDLHIKPSLGKIPVRKLTPQQVDRWLASKGKDYRRNYVSRMRSVLVDALTHAERQGVITRNVARLSVMPKCKEAQERKSLTAVEASELLAAAGSERLGALVAGGLMLGLRPRELTGLLWSDVDLGGDPPTITISGSMKRQPSPSGKGYVLIRGKVKRSKAGQRTLGLPLDLVRRLRDHRRKQGQERLSAGELWEDHGLVFASEVGTPLDPSNVRRTFQRVATRSGLDARFPYLLRHTAASLLIDSGAAVEQVADLLGDDPRTLYKHYRHRVRPVVTTAAERMGAILSDESASVGCPHPLANRMANPLPLSPSLSAVDK